MSLFRYAGFPVVYPNLQTCEGMRALVVEDGDTVDLVADPGDGRWTPVDPAAVTPAPAPEPSPSPAPEQPVEPAPEPEHLEQPADQPAA